jgi:hypothetical protein
LGGLNPGKLQHASDSYLVIGKLFLSSETRPAAMDYRPRPSGPAAGFGLPGHQESRISMRSVNIAELKNQLSKYLGFANRAVRKSLFVIAIYR